MGAVYTKRKTQREDECEEEEGVPVLGTVKVSAFHVIVFDEDCSLNG